MAWERPVDPTTKQTLFEHLDRINIISSQLPSGFPQFAIYQRMCKTKVNSQKLVMY